jgi:hypothetical protein
VRSIPAPLLLVVVLWQLNVVPAAAQFSTAAAGSGATQVATLTPPDAPVVDSSGISGLFCNANVAWPRPPSGAAYRLLRTIGNATITVAGPFTSAGIISDSVPLATIDGNLGYALYEEWVANPLWVEVSTGAFITNC